jgi:phosphatidate cytidylyltransferase
MGTASERGDMLRGLGLRVVSGAVLLALVLAAIWLRGPLLALLVTLAAILAAHEFYTVVRRAGYMPWYSAGIGLSLLLALRGYLGGDLLTGVAYLGPGVAVEIMIVALVLLLGLVRQGAGWMRAPVMMGRPVQPLASRSPYLAWPDLGLTLAGAIYTGGLLGYAPLLAGVPEGPGGAGGTTWLLIVLLGTAACDTGAYFVGSTLGRHKLIPHISPGKTWEGLAGGVLGAVVAAVALSGPLRLDVWQAVVLGLMVCAAAVSGDLCESLLKRAAGVKDSGTLIPGHGGILDRVDSYLFVLPAVFWFAQIVGQA